MRPVIVPFLILGGAAHAQAPHAVPHWAEAGQKFTRFDFGEFASAFQSWMSKPFVDPVNGWWGSDSVSMLVAKGQGPMVQIQRFYRSNMAQAGIHAPGLPDGWTHSFYLSIRPKKPKSWDVIFQDYTGSQETFEAVLQDGKPTGQFQVTVAPYSVSGEPDDETGTWKSITLHGYDKRDAEFIPSKTDPTYYHLHKLVEDGRSASFKYAIDDGTRVVQIDDEDGDPLMKFVYDNGWLSTISTDKLYLSDNYQDQFQYTVESGSVFLTSESQTFGSPQVNTAVLTRYHYGRFGEHFLMDSFSVPYPFQLPPPPRGHPFIACFVSYDEKERVGSIVGPDNHPMTFDYGGSQTRPRR